MKLLQEGITFICLSVCLVPINGQWTLESSSSVAVVGTDFTLTCTVPQNTAVPAYVFWTRDILNSVIIVNTCKTADNLWPSYTYTCNNKVFTLTIPGDDIDPDNDNNAQWRCGDGAGRNSNSVIIIVFSPVQRITMNGTNPLVVHEGSTVTIMCTTSPSRPAAYVVWSKGTDNITSNATGVVEKKAGDKYVTRSYLSLTGNRGDNGKIIKCEGYNRPAAKVLDSTTLEIWYAAGPANKPNISGYVNGTALLEDSTAKHELICRQSDCNPLCTLTWHCEGLKGTNRNTQTEAVSAIQVPLQRQYNGKTCKCKATHTSLTYTKHVSVIFTIHYPPDVNIELVNVTEYETSNVKIVCVASGVPPVYNYIGWKQMIGNSTVRTTSQFTGLSDDRRVLTFDNVTFADAGLYSCEVSNNVKSPQTATAYFDVKATAKFKPDAKMYTFYSGLEQKLVVTIPFFSNPPAKVSDIKWFNLSDNSVIGNDENTFDLIYSPFNTSLYSNAVSLHGQIARMHILSFQNYHKGNYSVSIANGLSTFSSTKFWIMLRSRPHRPSGIRAVCTSINTAEVIWISRFNGGSIQHFNIVVRVAANVLFQNREKISDPGKDEIVSAIIDNFHDETQYFFTVYAENDYGQSAPTDVFNCTTPKKDTRVLRCETGPSAASIVLFVLSSLFIVCGTMVFTVRFFVERRNNKLLKRKKKSDKALDLTNIYQELGEREQPVDKPYQEVVRTAAENKKDERNVYQEISGRDSLDKQRQQAETIIGQPPESNKGNVYDELAKRDRPNVYEKIKC